MSLLFMDSFDHYTGDPGISGVGKWGGGSGATSTNVSQFRTGTSSLRVGIGTTITKVLPASGGCVVGFAMFGAIAFTASNDIVQVMEGSVVHVALAMTTGGLITLKRGATIIATGTTVLALNSWNYIELKTVIHDTIGTYEVRINGVVEAALTATGADTRNVGTTGQWDRVSIGAGTAANNTYIDDFYLCDTSGSIRNDFLGMVKVECLLPQTDAAAVGSNQGLTPSTGTDHGALVDENPPNTTDYNGSATVGVLDTYNYPNMTLSGSVLGVQTNLYAAKSDAGARTIARVIRPSIADYPGTAVSPGTTFSYHSEIRETNPDTLGDWTVAAINATQFGMKVIS